MRKIKITIYPYINMDNVGIFLSGVSIVVSIFLIFVSYRALGGRKVRILYYLIAVFILILIENIILVIQVFIPLPISIPDTNLILFVNLVILLLFYGGIVRGSG